jgi:DNA-binding response OmpR family regulator
MTTNTNKKYILVAEDDKFYSNIYKTKLTKEGFEVVVAANGEEALHHLRERKPDILILDLIMPIKDGFEVLHEIRTDSKLKDLKVIALSNLGQEEDKKRVNELGVLEYLVKTNLSIQEVTAKIKNYLK